MKNTKKTFIMSIIVITCIILIGGGSYAWLNAAVDKNIDNPTKTGDINISYIKGQNISGGLSYGTTKEDGLTTALTISKDATSIKLEANVYITAKSLPIELSVPGLKWEVYGTKNNSQVYYNNGTFSNVSVESPIKIVDSYALDTTITTFNIYIWLNGNEVGNEVAGKTFEGIIHADSNQITGNLD